MCRFEAYYPVRFKDFTTLACSFFLPGKHAAEYYRDALEPERCGRMYRVFAVRAILLVMLSTEFVHLAKAGGEEADLDSA